MMDYGSGRKALWFYPFKVVKYLAAGEPARPVPGSFTGGSKALQVGVKIGYCVIA